jgi:hypothetical protein
MSKLLHPLPPSYSILASATISLEHQYSIIKSIDETKEPDLKRSRKDTLERLDFEFEEINLQIEFINQQITKSLRFKSGGQKLAYPSYVNALEKCTELLIHMEQWAIWNDSKMAARRSTKLKAKYSANVLICKNEITKLEATLGRKLIGSDYLSWARRLRKTLPYPPVPKAPRNQKHNGTPLKPIRGAPVLNTANGWSESTLRKIFEELTGCKPTTKK